MRIRAYAPAAVVGMTFALTALLACATPTVIAVGQLSGSAAGSSADRSGLVGTLEDGSAMNLLGGIRSRLAWAGGNTFIAMPDRGPNASTYNPLVDSTTSYIDRFQTVQMALTPVPSKIELGATFELQAIAVAVPELQTYALFAAGIGLLAWIVRRRRR